MSSGQTDDAPPIVEVAIARVLGMMAECVLVGGDLEFLASQPNLAPQLRALFPISHLSNEQRTTSPPPLAQPQTLQLSEAERFLLFPDL
jgi:hypothetical protein